MRNTDSVVSLYEPWQRSKDGKCSPLWTTAEIKGWQVPLYESWQRSKDGRQWLLARVRLDLFVLQPGSKTKQHNLYCHECKPEQWCRLTFSLTDLTNFLTFASQNAPLYLALTSVPIGKKAGSNVAWNMHRKWCSSSVVNQAHDSNIELKDLFEHLQ